METVGVIGGGQMGSQIAALAAMAGYETHVYDSDSENLKSKIKFTEDNLSVSYTHLTLPTIYSV